MLKALFMLATIEETQRLNAKEALPIDTTIEQFKSRYNLNGDQIEAITTTNAPVQIIAGSGAGKTLVLILRTLYLLMTGSVRPKGMQTVRFSVLLRARDSP